jgi:ParB family chromosome partitioning protein
MLPADRLWPNPYNPRRELGDLNELMESIMARGVMQPLTVVPRFPGTAGTGADDPEKQKEMGHTVVIGHRRLAAAKLAGLPEVPCVVADMDLRTQVSVMLAENMQRCDLTLSEEIEGIQMALDLGETVNGIAEKTGLSQKTVKRRVKIAKLGVDAVRDGAERGATLEDYENLLKIKDEKKRGEILQYIGTSSFSMYINRELFEQQKADNRIKLNEFMSKLGAQNVDDREGGTDGLKRVESFLSFDLRDWTPPDGDYVWWYEMSDYNCWIYREYLSGEEQDAKSESYAEKEARILGPIREASQIARNCRLDFMLSDAADGDTGVMLDFVLSAVSGKLSGAVQSMRKDTAKIFEKETGHVLASGKIAYKLFVTVWWLLDNTQYNRVKTYNWDGEYSPSPLLEEIYDTLAALGYSISDDERALLDGAHTAYVRGSERMF